MSGTMVTPTHVALPSTARVGAIDGFVPVPRGAVATLPIMPSWPVKDPADVLDYGVDLSAAVAGDTGDAIAGVVVTITPNASGDLRLNSAGLSGTDLTLWFTSGNAGTICTVLIAATMASGRVLSRSIALPCYSLSVASPTSANLLTDAGQVLTDDGGNPIVVGS